MMIASALFYLFAAILVISALCVVTAKNTVHGVLWLIFAFFNTAGLFILMGAEFIAMMTLIVYVGAVAVLFLFVVMMLDLSHLKRDHKLWKALPLGGGIAAMMLVQLLLVFQSWDIKEEAYSFVEHATPQDIENTKAIGRLLYTDYAYLFQVAGLILLVAMIGAITLTFRRRSGVRRQDVQSQVDRKVEDVLKMQKPRSGEGMNIW